jgi:hypothetical protein
MNTRIEYLPFKPVAKKIKNPGSQMSPKSPFSSHGCSSADHGPHGGGVCPVGLLGFRIVLLTAPSLSVIAEKWHFAVFVPDHSGGPAPDLHEVPY